MKTKLGQGLKEGLNEALVAECEEFKRLYVRFYDAFIETKRANELLQDKLDLVEREEGMASRMLEIHDNYKDLDKKMKTIKAELASEKKHNRELGDKYNKALIQIEDLEDTVEDLQDMVADLMSKTK